jgi:hypothetical protein
MEAILQDIGLSRYSHILRENGFTYRYFIGILKAQHNAPQMRYNVIQECGLTNADVLAILDRI